MQIKDMAASHAKTVLADLGHAIRNERTVQIMLVILIVCLVCWQMPFVKELLYPFKLFVTTIHEACHALVTRLTGGQVGLINIAPDESGVTLSMGGIRFLVVMAGYLGTAVFGGLLIWWGRKPEEARFILQSIGTVILALTVFYAGGSIFGFVSMLLIGVGILMVSRKASQMACHMFLLVLAVITTLSSVLDIQTLFFASLANIEHSDAKSMESITGVPAVIWSILWGVVAVCILIFSMWISYRPSKGASAGLSGATGKSGVSAASQDAVLAELDRMKHDSETKAIGTTPDSEGVKVKLKEKDKNKAKRGE